MIYELRTYDVKPGMLGQYLQCFNDVGMRARAEQANLVGFWQTEFGALSRVVHLWRYENLDQRSLVREKLMLDTRWAVDFLPKAMPMIDRMESVILNPVSFSPLP